jgi:hypothetical protein
MASNGATDGAPPLDKANGRATVHTFDPDASPEEKASAAGKARDKLKPVKEQQQEQPSERGRPPC